jgi:DNA-binding GntR family transcriptional regulator
MMLVSQLLISPSEGDEMELFARAANRSDVLPRQPAGTKADGVYLALKEQLIEGERAYGTTLSTAELALEFGVSRRPVMDAMMRLEALRLIEIIPQVGCRVVVPDRRMVREHFYAAGVLDGAAARLAASHASAADLSLLHDALAESAAGADALDQRAFQDANKRFHMALLVAAGNRRIADLAYSSWDLSDFYLQRRSPQDLRRSHEEHEAIYEAIELRDPERARDTAEAHLARFGDEAILPHEIAGS